MRYDRQLRLWGPDGQARLAAASVLCHGSSAVAAEVLKNLILPGIGSVHIVDATLVGERDLGQNFFLQPAHLGLFRGQAVAGQLALLNPDCKVSFSPAAPPDTFDVVVFANSRNSKYSPKCAPYLVSVESKGFLGRVKIFASHPHLIIDPKDGRLDDLRIANPWPELADLYESFWKDATEEFHLSHIPYFAILHKCKTQASSVSSLRGELEKIHNVSLGGAQNFSEASQNLFRLAAVVPDGQVVHELERMVEKFGSSCGGEIGDFLAVISVILDFYRQTQTLPQSVTSPPDMTCFSEAFTRIVGLYRKKVREDLTRIKNSVPKSLDPQMVESVVRNVRKVSIREIPPFPALDSLASPPRKKHSPAVDEEQQRIMNQLDEDDSADCELHALSSLVGALAAQEIVKLVTKQFVPIQNAWVFDGTTGSGFSYSTVS